MARPRTITDQRLLDAAGEVIGRVGPGFTLAQVAAAAQVSVGTVAQRFGSKAGLLRALTTHWTARVADEMRATALAEGSPVDGLRAAAVVTHLGLGDAETAANHLGQLGMDLVDPVLRGLLGEHYAAMEAELCAAVERALPDLPRAPLPERAARVLLAVVNGVSMDWSIRPVGALGDRLTEDVDAVIDGWRER
ncbi:TetR/AcrR family transcriptional regulator [Actinokineospora sp. HUAS TT18]|uniref:TetR/AcrR family transcriptional regulator n=1 Tax=Actinokineospora sp. HUAS TT18 TaxID=3447451 RepID=UPI003F51D9C2